MNDIAAPQIASTAAAGPSAAGVRPDPSAQLVAVFREIAATRMHGVPLLNPALDVEAVGFRRWDGRWLGVLITPWFMNLMLLPDAPAAWQHKRYGEYVGYTLPSGVYEFLSAYEPAFGDYHSCSLFSPMFEFADQAGARATAEAVLHALFDPQAQAGAEGPGTSLAPAAAAAPAAPAEPARAAVSKRDFLRGRWTGGSPTE